MSLVWHPTRWQNWCIPESEKKRQNQISKKLVDNKIWWRVIKSMQRWNKVVGTIGRSGKNTFSACRQYIIWSYGNIFPLKIPTKIC